MSFSLNQSPVLIQTRERPTIYSLSVFLFNGRNSLPAISRWMQVDAPGVQSDDRPAHNSFSADYCLGCYRSIAIPTPKCCVWAGKSDV